MLDVGSGADSAFKAKLLNPSITYDGVDVVSYGGENAGCMNRLYLADGNEFARCIEGIEGDYDLVMSYHNIEHCEAPFETLRAMCSKVKKGGVLYLAFPSVASVNFPERQGTLNFYQDKTHIWMPDPAALMNEMRSCDLEIVRCQEPLRNPVEYVFGALLEPLSRWRRRLYFGTWAYWGFETVIVGRRI